MLRPVANERQEEQGENGQEPQGSPATGDAVPFPRLDSADRGEPDESTPLPWDPKRHGRRNGRNTSGRNANGSAKADRDTAEPRQYDAFPENDDPQPAETELADEQTFEASYIDPTPPDSVGAILSHTRLKFGQDLRQVSQSLRIRLSYLEAIEADRHADLPGLAYAVGFVRSYADYLGIDSKSLVQRYKDEAQGLTSKTHLVFPAPVQEAKVPTGAIVLVGLLLLGVAYGGWTYFSRDGGPPPTPLTNPPAAEESASAAGSAGGTSDPTSTQSNGNQSNGTAIDGSASGSDMTASGLQAGSTSTGGVAAGGVAGDPASDQTVTGGAVSGSGMSAPSVSGGSSSGGNAFADSDVPLAGTSSGGTATVTPDGSLGGPLTSPIDDPATASVPAAGSGEALAAEMTGEGVAAEEGSAPGEPEGPQVVDGVTLPPNIPEAPPAPETVQEAVVPPPDPNAPRVILHATQDSWVQIRNAADEAILTQVLREGEVYAVPNEPGLVLLTGNAGGLKIEVDGKELPPLGAVGAVKRNVSLDPDTLAN